MRGSFARSDMDLIRAAALRVESRSSMTHGPAMNEIGLSAPMLIPFISTALVSI